MGSTLASQPSTWSFNPTDVQYGMCMKGWINTIEIYRSSTYNFNWDLLFNADVDTQNDLDNFIISQTNYLATGKFRIPGVVDSTAD
jgi:hypothetical protein